MLQRTSSKLTRSAFNSGNKTRNPFYYQSVFQSQHKTALKQPQSHIMSGSALNQLRELMQMIDEFELNIKNKQKQQKSEAEQKYPPHILPIQQNQTIPPVLSNTNIPVDAAFRPKLPKGHTAYSWTYSNVYIPAQEKKEKAPKTQAPKPKKKGNKRRIIPQKMLKVGDVDDSKQSFGRRDHLRLIEKDIQAAWDKAHVFESDPEPNKAKFLCTFPYPYMNGYLHLGHAFTITKAEFRAGYERLKGKNVLFPFAFHCTGMPIAAAAKRIASEIAEFGDADNIPRFPANTDNDNDTAASPAKHSKLQSKQSNSKYQWEIMKEFDLTDGEIAKFRDPHMWLSHFPPIGKQHLREFGLKVDWRRSFITTEANPYYSKFIEWQFLKLKAGNKIEFGNRPTIFSPAENQPCADHDRSSGEKLKAQQYTLIKMELMTDFETPFVRKNGDKLASLYGLNKKIYLVAATLRPETMYGQTNCFVLPRGAYLAIEVKGDEVFICSQHSARNMAWQEFTETPGEYKVLCQCEGWDLLGRALSAPHAVYDTVYVLPLTTIKMDKGTGIVTSVPSDAPSDYAALKDAKKDKKFRDKYYLTDAMVTPFEVVPIIHIDEFDSDQSAVDLCEKYKVKTQNDTTKLEEIKQLVYKYGHAQGVMLVGDFIGEKVSAAKEKCQRQLVRKGLAAIYWEPEDTVMSRTGSKCVVAFCDQWFLKYGIQDADDVDSKENAWQQAVKQHIVNGLECYNENSKGNFLTVVDWLHSWACSREFGLGTKLPWDREWVIESLSDSTIYMAYYTIAHHLQNESMDGGAATNKIEANHLTPQVFEAVFCRGDIDAIDFEICHSIDRDLIMKMRAEFEYYYPMDLRVSGKDLIFNHLTMALYNHAAIWPGQARSRWPQSYFTNGWAMLDAQKMSKSTGNFLTIKQCVQLYGADATRFALANAGDTLEDANFETDVANAAILGLTRFENFVEDTFACLEHDQYRSGHYNEFDVLFANAINRAVNETDIAFKEMKFRDVLRFGYHILQSNADYYVAHVNGGVHRELIQRFIDVQLLLLSPICPHICESLWAKIHRGNGFIVNALWPRCTEKEDLIKTLQFESLQKISHSFRYNYNADEKDRKRKLNKAKKGSDKQALLKHKLNGAQVVIAADYKAYHKTVLAVLAEIYDSKSNALSVEDWRQYLLQRIGVGGEEKEKEKKEEVEVEDGGKKKKKKKKKLSKEQQEQLAFAAYLVKEIMPDRKKETFNPSLAYDEFTFLESNKKLLFHEIDVDLKKVTFFKESDKNAPQNIKQKCKVGDPAVKFIFVD